MRVLYVLGLNRTGSTIFERALGTIDGVFAGGEIHNLFLWPYLERECGCRKQLQDCPVWGAVFAELERDIGMHVDVYMARVATLHAVTGRTRHMGKILRRSKDARELADLLFALYKAIATATGSQVVVDSSKGAAGALLLRLMPVDAQVVHLVRNPLATIQSNGVGRSWDGVDQAKTPPRISSERLAATQLSISFAARVMHATAVSFEDFLGDPAVAVAPLGVPGTAALKEQLEVEVSHQCEGNPTRFGVTTLSPYQADQRGTPTRAARVEAAVIGLLRRLA